MEGCKHFLCVEQHSSKQSKKTSTPGDRARLQDAGLASNLLCLQIVWIKTSYRTRKDGIKDQKNTFRFFTSDQMSDDAAINDSEEETLSGETNDENIKIRTDRIP